MSSSTRSYSKESTHYSRSSSYHASSNKTSSNYRQLTDDRPLSSRLIERDSSFPSLSWYWNDPFLFDRIRCRWNNDFFKWNYALARPNLPIYYRSWNNSSSSKIIPIQYSPSCSSINRRQISARNDESSSSSSLCNRHDENSMSKRNILLFED